MFNFNNFRVWDLDEMVWANKEKGEPIDFSKEEVVANFCFSKTCSAFVCKKKGAEDVLVSFSTSALSEQMKYGKESGVTIEQIDLNSLFENLMVLDYLESRKSIFRRQNQDTTRAYDVLKNISALAEGKPVSKELLSVVSKEDYEKALQRAIKAHKKEQEATIDSQTPSYEG